LGLGLKKDELRWTNIKKSR